MKKKMLYVATLIMSFALTLQSCSDDNDTPTQTSPENIDYTKENSANWNRYMNSVATLLVNDATNLYTAWNSSYNNGQAFATTFKNHDNGSYTSALSCVEQIIDGCIDIATEVGETKIGDPYSKYVGGDQTAALYAVESWYSWHSREDYSNNIISICNAFCGTRNASVIAGTTINTSSIESNSLYSVLASQNPTLATKTLEAIKTAYDAILSIPQPFRNHIASAQSVAAQDACAKLQELLENQVKPAFSNTDAINSDAVLDPVVAQYVDVVVVPTYSELKTRLETLKNNITTLSSNPTSQAFKNACDAWIAAREPWETSEAFLFGPVADQGLDPNMDSWPLDQAAIVNIINTGSGSLDWSGEYNEDDESIAAKQGVRGFHTLEFLLFKDGEARTIK